MENLVQCLKPFIPPIAQELIKRVRRDRSFFLGDYGTWEDACRNSIGLDGPNDLGSVVDATLRVIRGEGEFERDGVLFHRRDYDWLLLAILHSAACRNDGCLGVLDLGGALGSAYHKNKNMLTGLRKVRWCIVEQAPYVDIGRKQFSSEELVFYNTIDECVEAETINVVYMSGVLQYLRSPHDTLNHLLDVSFEYIVVDRTPFVMNRHSDRLTVQNMPDQRGLVKNSCPHWFLEKKRFEKEFADHNYVLVHEFESGIDKSNLKDTGYYGYVFQRRKG